ncbi:hypothetical protein M8494_11275 [Serratia ureilytica]
MRARSNDAIGDRRSSNRGWRCWLTETRDNGKPDPRNPECRSAAGGRPFPLLRRLPARAEGTAAEIDQNTVAYHIYEPLGVVGQIIRGTSRC